MTPEIDPQKRARLLAFGQAFINPTRADHRRAPTARQWLLVRRWEPG
ncbi:MAG: hypothetical protein JXC32_02315 [Anaerolineae bacterium]|nr:hypothetical protein [Anaerolineae bacterium]